MRLNILTLAALLSSVPAETDDLAGLLLRFFAPDRPTVILREGQPSHAAHFLSQPNAQATLTQLNRSLASQLATFPLGSSSAGFTYTFDSALGVYNRSAETFGPLFAERAITAGKGKFSFGVSYLRATYDRLEGTDLDSGELTLYLTHEDTNRDNSSLNLWFEGDLIRSDLFLDLSGETAVVFANYGVSDRFDLGVAVPFVRVELDARIRATVDRLATQPDPFIVHIFPDGRDSNEFRESGSASGIGDVVVRAKYNFLRQRGAGLALGLDARLPTGREEDLLGSGTTQIKPYLAIQGPARKFSPHANVGYTFSSGESDLIGGLPDEFDYSAGFDAALHPRVTLTADFIGRLLRDADRIVLRDSTFRHRFRTDPTVRQVTRQEIVTEKGNLNLALGSAGLKINPAGRLLISANVLFAIGDAGLQDRLTPVFAIDYSF